MNLPLPRRWLAALASRAFEPVARVGHQRRLSSGRSDTCRRVLFDNRTGVRREAGEVFCGQSADQVVDAETSNRLNSLSKSFHR